MSFSGLQKIKRWSSLGLLLLASSGMAGCQALASGVDAILRTEDSPGFSIQNNSAFLAFEQGNYAQAVSLFQDAIEIESNPDLKANLYNGLGLSFNELNQRPNAVLAYQESLSLNRDNAQVWVNLGIVQRLDGDYDEALKSYEVALTLDSQLATAHSSIGSLRVLQGQPKLAIASFESALELDANMSVSHGNLALAHAMVGEFDAAQVSLRRAVALGYANADLIQSRINELQKLKR